MAKEGGNGRGGRNRMGAFVAGRRLWLGSVICGGGGRSFLVEEKGNGRGGRSRVGTFVAGRRPAVGEGGQLWPRKGEW